MSNKALIQTDICIIGAGSGGLSVAAGASQMGADVVLIEKSAMGGDSILRIDLAWRHSQFNALITM